MSLMNFVRVIANLRVTTMFRAPGYSKVSLRRRAIASLCAAFAALVFATIPAFGQDDYVHLDSTAVAVERVEPLASPLEAPCLGCGEPVSYTAFDGSVHPLTRYEGLHVQLLLPDSWIDGDGLSAEEREALVDRADFYYAHAKELVGREPLGSGKLPIAVVPSTCGSSMCGSIGTKGVEVDADLPPFFWSAALSQGVIPDELGHEIAHNFDVFHGHLFLTGSGPNAHAWTAFLHRYLNAYAQMGSYSRSPEQEVDDALRDTYELYYADSAASWELCVAEGSCALHSADDVWAGVTHRFAELHGSGAVKSFLREVGSFATHSPPPATLEEAADRHVQAMGRALKRNVECYAEGWGFPLSSAARSDLQRFAPAEACTDADGDGYSRLQGDCADADPARHPEALTDVTTDGIDDDCDGLVDEGEALAEAEGSDFADDTWMNNPGQASGRAGALDTDSFTFDWNTTESLDVELCGEGYASLTARSTATALGLVHLSVSDGCTRFTRAFSPLYDGPWRIEVFGDARYWIEIRPGVEWPAPSWGTVSVNPTATACRYTAVTGTYGQIVLDSDGALPSATDANRARFWVSGVGFVGSAKYGAEASIKWTPAQGEGRYRVRAQLQSDEEPASDWSEATAFEFVRPAGGCGPCDDGVDNDGDGLVDAGEDPGCKDLASSSEAPACDDGLDNDGDGAVDWDGGPTGQLADSYCAGKGWVGSERVVSGGTSCGLLGIELLLVWGVDRALRSVRRSR